jgi:transposase
MLGIDVSKASLADTVLDEQTYQVQAEGTLPNTDAGITRLLRQIPAAHRWVAEPTGPYSQAVVAAGHAAGRTVLLAQPRQAKAFLRSVSPRAKTDRLDSRGLARFALAVPLRPFPVKPEVVVQLEQLLAARKGLSHSLAQLKQQRQVLPAAATVLDDAISGLQQHQRRLDRQIAHLTQQPALAVAQRLDQIPGIGPVTAAALAACFASHAFTHPDHFVAYIGLDVRVHDSGQRSGQRGLSKRGDAELRRSLYLCAQANQRSRDPANPFQCQYQREREKGLSTTAALNAVARKLARTAWSLAAHGTTYDPARVHRQPARETPASLDSEP